MRFGRRLLQKWVRRPLLDKFQLEECANTVEEMIHSKSEKTQRLKNILKNMKYDLEKGLIRIYYGKVTSALTF